MTKYSEKNNTNGFSEFTKPAGIPRIPRVNPNSGWQSSNLEMTDSGSRNALVTKDQTETKAVRTTCRLFYSARPKWNHAFWFGERLKWLICLFQIWDYDNPDDTRSYRSQAPSRTGYGPGNNGLANNGPKASRNPYFDAYDDKMRRY